MDKIIKKNLFELILIVLFVLANILIVIYYEQEIRYKRNLQANQAGKSDIIQEKTENTDETESRNTYEEVETEKIEEPKKEEKKKEKKKVRKPSKGIHRYKIVTENNITWKEADRKARNSGLGKISYLAHIESEEELYEILTEMYESLEGDHIDYFFWIGGKRKEDKKKNTKYHWTPKPGYGAEDLADGYGYEPWINLGDGRADPSYNRYGAEFYIQLRYWHDSKEYIDGWTWWDVPNDNEGLNKDKRAYIIEYEE